MVAVPGPYGCDPASTGARPGGGRSRASIEHPRACCSATAKAPGHDGLRYACPKCAVSRWPPPYSGCRVVLLPDTLASGSHGRTTERRTRRPAVRFTGPEKEPHETLSGLHRHGTGVVSTPCVVRDLVRAACRSTSTPACSDSGRSDQQGPPLLLGRPHQPARSRQPKPRPTRRPRA